jgi:hypothetical protein
MSGKPRSQNRDLGTHSKSRGSADFRQRSHGLGPTKGDENTFCSATTLPWKHRPPLCHLDRSAAKWRDLCVDALSWECFSTERTPISSGAVHVRHHSFLAVEQSVVDIGPELPQDECRSVQADVCQPALAGLRPGALLFGIVEIRNT